MTQPGYGQASQNRFDDLAAVVPDVRGQTWLKVRVYINNEEVQLPMADGSLLSDRIFKSRDKSYESSSFSTWPGASEDVKQTGIEAEVGACEETYQALWRYATTHGSDAQRVDFEFTAVNGTCNPCKERIEYLRESIKTLFPSAQVTRGERSRVTARANYSAALPASAVPGRGDLTTYGFAPGQAELRESAAAVAAGLTGRDALYYQGTLSDQSGSGLVDPQHLTQIPDHAGPARTDRSSPSGSLRTPSPTSSDPGNPWQWSNDRNTHVSQTTPEAWWAMDPAQNKAIPLKEFDRRYPGGYPSQVASSSTAQVQGPSQGQVQRQGRS
ncbi:hypothetical protein ACGFIK_13435 [Micromonospora sp. NPDC048871]|uniref:hypothetical protein n=1 Tax=unclassified Micromonospora TaxID=2617518 RepID=UPI002E12AAB6|nr:hypothetical protein OIE53_09910 [Micromonospora sp. NBC_01739]